jgi:Na+/H+ antiporter NhaC
VGARLEAPLALRVRVGGAPAHPGGRVERAVRTALRDLRERPPTGGTVPPLMAGRAPGAEDLVFDVEREGSVLAVRGALRGRRGEVALPPAGRWIAPDRSSLLPPLVAIAVALVWQRTLLALFLGILAGAVAGAARQGAGLLAPLRGALDVFTVYLAHEVTSSFRFEILGFIVALLAMVGVMSRAGGVAGLVESIARRARSARSAQLVTWSAGLLIFFDDYANCMLVGSTLRPLTDRMRVSREKLAYIVDSTAAPVAGLSLLSTWIAFQVSIFAPQLPAAGIAESGYAVFWSSLPYRSYCWLTIFFVLAVALSGRDFGPMGRAERRARRTGEVTRRDSRPPLSDALARMQPAPGLPHAARRALVPLGVTLAVTVLRILSDGGGFALYSDPGGGWRDPARWMDVMLGGAGAGPIFAGALAGLGAAAFTAGSNALRVALGFALGAAWFARGWLGWGIAASLLGGAAVAAAFAIAARARGRETPRPHLSAGEMGGAAAAALPTLGFATVLLFEAWMIGAVCADLGTADYLIALLADALRPGLLPVLLFVAAALVSFATGSSWSTMSILLPNAVPLAAALGGEQGGPVMVAVAISAVLDGSIFGDHASPISDTTILSSVASGCDHLDHVRTQLPYALLVAAVALLAGYLPLALGVPWPPGAGLLGGAVLLGAALVGFGRRPGDASGSDPPGDPCPGPEFQ